MKIAFIIAQTGYQDDEYNIPKKLFEELGYQTTTVSQNIGLCLGSLGGNCQAEISLEKLNVSLYDAIIFVGGSGAYKYQKNIIAHNIAKEAISLGKVLGAICIAPTILAYAGVLKKGTVWNMDGKQTELFKELMIEFVDKPVVVDKNIVTANGPGAAQAFGEKIIELIK